MDKKMNDWMNVEKSHKGGCRHKHQAGKIQPLYMCLVQQKTLQALQGSVQFPTFHSVRSPPPIDKVWCLDLKRHLEEFMMILQITHHEVSIFQVDFGHPVAWL